jgi:hypothetical protein
LPVSSVIVFFLPARFFALCLPCPVHGRGDT